MHVMDFFDKHKALILTFLFCGIMLLALLNFRLSENRKDFSEMIIDLEEITEEPQKTTEEKEQDPQNSPETHRAFNENTKEREENFQQKIDEIFDKNSASQKENRTSENTTSQGNYSINTEDKLREASDGNNTSREISRQSGGLRNSSIFYSLKGRSARHIPNPVYTCDRAGKIVVNIIVNSRGMVIATAINKASSESNNLCLTEKALEYAADAVFSSLPGRDEQPGTITYNFKP